MSGILKNITCPVCESDEIHYQHQYEVSGEFMREAMCMKCTGKFIEVYEVKLKRIIKNN